MFLKRIVAAARRLARYSRGDALCGLYSTDQMRTVLQRERERADRTGDELSLLTLTYDDSFCDHRVLTQVARIIKERMRLTDEAGWLRPGQMGVVLPGTSTEGAWSLARDVYHDFDVDWPLPVCSVRHYPSSRGGNDDDSAGGSRRPADHRSVPSDSPQLLPASGELDEPLEALMVRRLPAWKRCLDVIGAGVGLLMLSPLFLLVAIAMKLTSAGPIFFCQQRGGLGGRRFVLYKFRSMVVDAEAKKQALMSLNEQDGPAFKIKHDPRITRLGRLLRKTSIDELPQLWNVLKGDMSLVGPRPLPCDETASCAGWERQRLDVTPGLTCIWQVTGRSKVSFAEWVRMDVRYIRNRSLLHDLKLLLKTIPAILFSKDAC